MKKIGVTGSLASGKTTASKFLSNNKGPLFSADKIVKKLYTKKTSKKIFQNNLVLKIIQILDFFKKKILTNINYIKKLEKIIHPLVRKEMLKFIKKIRKKLHFF